MNRFLTFIISSFVIFACSVSQSDEEKLERFVKTVDSSINLQDFTKIIIIHENDGCPTCINLFANEHIEQLTKQKTLFIISASGAKVDISSFIEHDRENVIWDSNMDFQQLGILKNSGIIHLDRSGKIIGKENNKFAKQED